MTISSFETLIPRPGEFQSAAGVFVFDSKTRILAAPGTEGVGQYLAEKLRPATGLPLLMLSSSGAPQKGSVSLVLRADSGLGEEGYVLEISTEFVSLSAGSPAGLFYGVQTIRQLLPEMVECDTPQAAAWQLPAGTIRDMPRYAWRGMMLDVARHFFGPADIKHLIDLLALYKMNRLHLHLTDDQGWRLEITSWPKLAHVGGSSAVGGDPGGFYTQAEYADLVRYAQRQFVTIVPEIDMPGHVNAAVACYPELNFNDSKPGLYTGTEVGFSSFGVHKEITYKFLDDVIGELARITPGEYIHIGGDEAASTPKPDYLYFMGRVQALVQKHGKKVIGWNELSQVDLLPTTAVQYWVDKLAPKAIEQGVKIVMSPAKRTYLDMKYTPDTPLGLTWAALIEVKDAYDWDPGQLIAGVQADAVWGVEAPLWAETLRTIKDIEYMTFPRLPGLAEVGWTPQANRSWDEYCQRLAAHSPRFAALGLNYYASPQIPWPAKSAA